MLDRKINDKRAWTAATIDEPSQWYYTLPQRCPTDGEMRAALAPVLDALEHGRGFAIVESPPLARADAMQLYCEVGEGLGTPFAQNVDGVMFYDVRDTGQDLTKGARFSVTNYESSFHTDNSFGDDILDYVGLLCLQVAKSGGRSQIVSGCSVHNVMLQEYPNELATLYEPFHIDRRGGVRTGESSTVRFPVFANRQDELVVRYLRYWIEAGHEKANQPLTTAQRCALDILDGVLNRPELRVEFDLKPGDMYFINNRWTLHNRTAFEDHPESERRRHLVRLWLQSWR